MIEFGKFRASIEDVSYSTLEDQSGIVKVIIFRNEAGEDLVPVLQSSGCPFFIATTDEGVVVALEEDPEQIQVADHNIIGIDSDYGETRGPGGSVYGKIWSGEGFVTPPEPQKDTPPLSARQFWKAALEIGVTEESLIATISDPESTCFIPDEMDRQNAILDISKATSFERTYPLLEALSASQGITPEQLDALWMWAHSTN